ncbi:ComEA family DNA-binding protein [Candidatus Electronema sp. JM]|uniref:ComEA family DNA-binding protein n=1 Tax=Candidatus Electronema sp. JM TaxID=3401571 RepID=UPI003AA89660
MNTQDRPVSADLRSLILLLFAAAVLGAGWLSSAPDRQASSYFWANGKLIRSQDGKLGQGIHLADEMACADIPPELAAFFHLPLPVNRADQAALMRLPGIGPKLAESIITYRAEHGGITGPDDLIKVKGIGPKRLVNLTPLLCFDANR